MSGSFEGLAPAPQRAGVPPGSQAFPIPPATLLQTTSFSSHWSQPSVCLRKAWDLSNSVSSCFCVLMHAQFI